MERLSRSTLTGGILHISVGADGVPFDAHIELLCDCSPFFNKVLEGRFEDTEEWKFVELPQTEPDTFAEFLHWAYRGTFFQSGSHASKEGSHSPVTWLDICRLWVLAEELGIPVLRDAVDEYGVTTKTRAKEPKNRVCMGRDAINYTYQSTPSGSRLREIAVENYVQLATKTMLAGLRGQVNHEFWEDCCIAQMERASIGEPSMPTPSPSVSPVSSPVRLPIFSANLSPAATPIPEPDAPRRASPSQLANRTIRSPQHRKSPSANSPISP